eukprot:1923171-Rhodomonas_salina.1
MYSARILFFSTRFSRQLRKNVSRVDQKEALPGTSFPLKTTTVSVEKYNGVGAEVARAGAADHHAGAGRRRRMMR